MCTIQENDQKRQLKELGKKAIDKWGFDAQFDMITEECAELIQAVNKVKRAKDGMDVICAIEDFTDEVADVEIVLSQIKTHLKIDNQVFTAKNKKLARLADRLNK
jgi:NTP pyrophosphatase (non-canonical NTP hydrolase)